MLVLLPAFTCIKGQGSVFPSNIKNEQTEDHFSKWRIGIQWGGAYLLSSFSDFDKKLQYMIMPQQEENNKKRQFRNGIYLGSDVHYFINDDFGAGLKYSLFTNSVEIDCHYWTIGLTGLQPIYRGTPVTIYYPMNMKNNIYVNYIGPSVVFNQWLNKNHKFRISEELSVGYAHYRHEDRYAPYQYQKTRMSTVVLFKNCLTKGNTWGGNIRLSFDYYLNSMFSIGASAGVFYAKYKTVKFSKKENTNVTYDLHKKYHIDMSRVDYSLGARFHF